jgi:hypothetical protein
MIQDKLKTALTAAGCDVVLYESAQLANIIADESAREQIIGLVLEPADMQLDAAGNGVIEHYPRQVVEIFQQVRPEDTAEHNATTLENLLTVAKAFLYQLKRTGDFYRIPSVPVTKLTERQYDANVVGWSLTLDLKYIKNALNC